MATTVTYKGQTLTTVDNTTKTLETAGTWMEDDLTLTDVSGGGGDNGYGGDGTWARPGDMPKLDDMDISGGDVVYLAYMANEANGFCSIQFKHSSGSLIFEVGEITNGTFVAESTTTYTANGSYSNYFGSANGTYKVIRITGQLSELTFIRTGFYDMGDGHQRAPFAQGLLEVYGELPHLTSFSVYGIHSVRAIHLGQTGTMTYISCYMAFVLESIDSANWDVSGVTSFASCFNSTRGLFKADLSNWTVSNATAMNQMFLNSSLTTLDMTNWDMAKVNNTSQFFQGSKQLSITVPASLSTISANAFNISEGQTLEFHFKAATPPTLANTNVFSGIKPVTKIYVPAGSLSDYQAATNWSNYSSYMVEETA